MTALKHNADALILAMAKGLRECSQDSSAAPMAIILRAVVQNSDRPLTDEGDAADALMLASVIDPMLEKLSSVQRDKLQFDLASYGLLFSLLAQAVRVFGEQGRTQ